MSGGSAVTKGFRAFVAEANANVETISAADAIEIASRRGATFVDVRDLPELERDGRISGAVHVSRGMLEFHFDPDSPYHKPELLEADRIVLYCASGGRSALAAQRLQEMGIGSVSHMAGGIRAWIEAGGEVDRGPLSS